MLNRFAFREAVTIALMAWSSQALALNEGDKESIRSLSNRAAADFQQGRYEAAKDAFTNAFQLARVPKLAVWAARSHEKLGKLVLAYELYLQALGLEPNELWKGSTQQEAQKEARSELERLKPRIPKLAILIKGANVDDVSVELDDLHVPNALLVVERYVDPGKHQVSGKLGTEVVTAIAEIAEGEAKEITLTFHGRDAVRRERSQSNDQNAKPQPGVDSSQGATVDVAGSPGHHQRTWGWAGVGVGAAGITIGAVSGLVLISKQGDLKDKCPEYDCRGLYTDDANSFNSYRTISIVGFAAGAVTGALGVTLLLSAPKTSNAPSIGVWLAPNRAGIGGNF